MPANKLLIPLRPEGIGAKSESLRSFLFALSRANAMPVEWLIERLEMPAVDGPKPSRIFSAGTFGPDINGHHPKTKKILDQLKCLGFGEMEHTTLVAFSDVSGSSMASLFRPTRSWCPLCWNEANDSRLRPYDMLIWAIKFVKRCIFHGIELQDRCPHCFATQMKYAFSSHTNCCHCESSLISGRKMVRRYIGATVSEDDVVSILEASSARPTFQYSQANLFSFARAYQCELSKISADAYHMWRLERRSMGWTRLLSTVRVVSLFAYAAQLQVPLRLLLERPMDAVGNAKVSTDFGALGTRGSDPLILDCEQHVSAGDEVCQREHLSFWNEQLWIPGQAAALYICCDKLY